MIPVPEAELLEALRARCVMRLAELSRFKDSRADDERGYRARWELTSHLLRYVEELPADLGAAEVQVLADLSLDAAVSVVDAALASGPTTPAASNAISGEADLLRGWLERPEMPVAGFVALPRRQVLDHAAYAEAWRALDASFPGARTTALGAPLPWHADRAELSRVLVGRGVRDVLLLHASERELSTRSDPRLLATRTEDGAPHYYPPALAYCTAPPFDFFVRLDAAADDRAAGWIEPLLHPR